MTAGQKKLVVEALVRAIAWESGLSDAWGGQETKEGRECAAKVEEFRSLLLHFAPSYRDPLTDAKRVSVAEIAARADFIPAEDLEPSPRGGLRRKKRSDKAGL